MSQDNGTRVQLSVAERLIRDAAGVPAVVALTGPAHRTQLPLGPVFEVYPPQGVVATIFPSGRAAIAQYKAGALPDLGYPDTPAMGWVAHVEHQLYLNVVAALLLRRRSAVLEHHAGEREHPLYVRHAELGLTMAMQRWMRTQADTDLPDRRLGLLDVGRREARALLLTAVNLLPTVPLPPGLPFTPGEDR
jgi:hypothetical protein